MHETLDFKGFRTQISIVYGSDIILMALGGGVVEIVVGVPSLCMGVNKGMNRVMFWGWYPSHGWEGLTG